MDRRRKCNRKAVPSIRRVCRDNGEIRRRRSQPPLQHSKHLRWWLCVEGRRVARKYGGRFTCRTAACGGDVEEGFTACASSCRQRLAPRSTLGKPDPLTESTEPDAGP